MRPLSLNWSKHLHDEDKKKNFEDLVRNSTVVLGRLKALLEEDLRSLDTRDTTEKDFEDPNWSHKQAFRNGDRARLKKVINLLEFIP